MQHLLFSFSSLWLCLRGSLCAFSLDPHQEVPEAVFTPILPEPVEASPLRKSSCCKGGISRFPEREKRDPPTHTNLQTLRWNPCGMPPPRALVQGRGEGGNSR